MRRNCNSNEAAGQYDTEAAEDGHKKPGVYKSIMTNGRTYIDSGILELYVLGCTSAEQSSEIEQLAAENPEVRQEITAIEDAMEAFAMDHAITPNEVVKPFLMATVDYTERLKNGEPATEPPLLHEHAVVSDYAAWLNRDDMVYNGEENIYAKIIGYTPQAISAIIWIKDKTPQELHHDEYEKFLVVEGSCDITVGDTVHKLIPGDYFAIPLHTAHVVQVTSVTACKIILQRVAA